MFAKNLEDVHRPGVIAVDKEDKVVLIVEVTGYPFDSNREKTREYGILQLIDYLQESKTSIPFGMFVDLEKILVFRWDGSKLSEVILSLNTVDVLSYYEPKFRDKQIFNAYLTGLIEAWIGDLCYRWKLEIPPALNEMAEIGLSQLLEGGLTQP
ncbi:MAG: hypothetical protein KME60_02790 [Cyanomargarita calcarea GSE-NOS-MK-12-04C]|jgi:hypothetical protein|uniref:Type I restriction enzyme R protein N-terminal domain-containing protein n=1 Tax=Cyanomargarita calcarea GSE-NOS-MK-12-04C TaxID=2839659 RepID=A0A951QHF9_9CYAN|nr:hypothetical protein [Cyanomargarita calcarea GSE-NOS-MK-12-04C]